VATGSCGGLLDQYGTPSSVKRRCAFSQLLDLTVEIIAVAPDSRQVEMRARDLVAT
jgi:hypothetical protein